MDTKIILFILLGIFALLLIVAGLATYLKCQPIIQVHTGCTTVPSSPHTNTPTGLCLLDCDQYSDNCYKACNSKDDQCIRECYAQKASCYLQCLEKHGIENLAIQKSCDCNCGKQN